MYYFYLDLIRERRKKFHTVPNTTWYVLDIQNFRNTIFLLLILYIETTIYNLCSVRPL